MCARVNVVSFYFVLLNIRGGCGRIYWLRVKLPHPRWTPLVVETTKWMKTLDPWTLVFVNINCVVNPENLPLVIVVSSYKYFLRAPSLLVDLKRFLHIFKYLQNF
jgi:hypothetical protein